MSRNSAGASSQHQFAKAPMVSAPRSTFDRSSSYKTTLDAGLLIPFFLDEIYPGDTIKLRTNVLARLATPIFPYMDNVYLDMHYFFVPNRLVWNNWERFNGAQDDPGDSTDFLIPQVDDATWILAVNNTGPSSPTYPLASQSLFDYFGHPLYCGDSSPLPQDLQDDMPSALPLRAYNLIYNEWYRDENLQDSVPVEKGDGPDSCLPATYKVLPRGRRKDYFTSALPWPQKGPSSVLPLGTSAPIATDAAVNAAVGIQSTTQSDLTKNLFYGGSYVQVGNTTLSDSVLMYADLSQATAATINQLRQAATLQQLFETDARGGTRYVELLLAHFGVQSPDFRLQRPEYLGGGTINVNVNPIAQTSETLSGSPQGNLAAFATVNGAQGFNHSFVEHGYVLGILSFRAETSYQGGLNRLWSRRTRFDFYWPTLAHLGEQAVLNKELFWTNTNAERNAVFGYQERFAELRYRPSTVTGKFRSEDPASLDSWHLAIDFGNPNSVAPPTLAGLVVENPPIDRIIAVPSEPQFILDSYTTMKHTRAMPTYSIPGLTRL